MNKIGRILLLIIGIPLLAYSCEKKELPIKKEVWGQIENDTVYLYTISNKNGFTVKITNYGGVITSILAPDKNGNFADIVLGFDNLEQYQGPHPSFGGIIGRVANWIENSQFTIDGTLYKLNSLSGKDILHGNNEFDRVPWNSKIIKNKYGKGIQLKYTSKDGTYGFPGTVNACVTYTLNEKNDLRVTYEATTDKSTHINMTQHSYFNLNGNTSTIYNHHVNIKANAYVKHDLNTQPTRFIESLNGKTWDLRTSTKLGDSITKVQTNGYALCYVLDKKEGELEEVANVIEPNSGRTLRVSTTQPGLVFYTGNYLDGNLTGKYNAKYPQHGGLCLETQHYPDAPNQQNFPSTLLRPDENYKEVAIYSFGVLNQ